MWWDFIPAGLLARGPHHLREQRPGTVDMLLLTVTVYGGAEGLSSQTLPLRFKNQQSGQSGEKWYFHRPQFALPGVSPSSVTMLTSKKCALLCHSATLPHNANCEHAWTQTASFLLPAPPPLVKTDMQLWICFSQWGCWYEVVRCLCSDGMTQLYQRIGLPGRGGT